MNHLVQNNPIELSSARAARTERYNQTQSALEDRYTDADEKIAFILDARGRIQFCSKPVSFTSNEQDLLGKSILHLVPGLPLREATPGYNIAYVRFTFAKNQWQRHTIKIADGSLQQVDISLTPIPLERGYCLLGLVKLQQQSTPLLIDIPMHAQPRSTGTHGLQSSVWLEQRA